METNENLLGSDLQIDSTGHAYLADAAKWANFLGIMGFIFSGLFAIFSLFAGTILSNSNPYGGVPMVSAGLIIVIYLVIAVVNFFMSLYLYRFASKMKIALSSSDQEVLNNSLMNLRNLYRLMGILVVIYLVFIVLALIIGVIGAAFMR